MSVVINVQQFSSSFQRKVVIPDHDPGLESSLGNKLQALLLFALVLVSAVAQPAFAQVVPDQPLFGPKQYLRTNGAPNQYKDAFSVPPSVGAPFLLRIVNGPANGSNRLSSASVTVNGVQVAGPPDFNQSVALITRPVSLGPNNTLEVRVASTPGGYLTVSVLGTLPPGPISLSPNPLLLAPGASGNLSATFAPAPTSAGTLVLTSANAGIASVPASVAFSAGQTAVVIPVTGVGAGSTTVTANTNGHSASATINVNAPPTVTLAANPATALAPATVTLTATAADPDGTVAKVEFFQGATLIATVNTPGPYTFTANSLGAGNYSFTVRATDNMGLTATSAPATVTVTASATAATIYYIYTDQLNTPRAITNEAATTLWKWDNVDPFGNNAPNENPSGQGAFTCNLRLPGQYFDRETNTHYNYFRDYDPSIGRYIQSDPIGLPGGVNTYSYVGGNPIRFIDPLGLQEICTRLWHPHTFLCVGDNCSGKYPSGNPLFSPGQIRDDSPNKSSASCSPAPSGSCDPESFSQCVATRINQRGSSGGFYNYLASNCGQWAVDVIEQCRNECTKK